MIVLILIPFVIMGFGVVCFVATAVIKGALQGMGDARRYWVARWRYRLK